MVFNILYPRYGLWICGIFGLVVNNVQAASIISPTLTTSQISQGAEIFASLLAKPAAKTAGTMALNFIPYVNVGMKIASVALMASAANQARLAFNTSSNLHQQTLTGWTNDYTPPSTATVTGYYKVLDWPNSAGGSTPDAACLAAQQSAGSSGHETQNAYTCNVWGYGNHVISYIQSCPAGYTLSGSTCNLSNATLVKWPSDGVPTYVPGADGTPATHPRDPDLYTPDATIPAWVSNDPTDAPASTWKKSADVRGINEDGKPTRQVTSHSPDGKTTSMKQSTQGTNADGTSQVTTTEHTVDNATGLTTSIAATTYNNTSIVNTTNTAPTTVDTSALAKDATVQQTNTLISGTNSKLDTVNTNLQGISNKLEKDQTNMPTIPGAKTFSETLSDFKTAITNGPLGAIHNMAFADGGTCPIWHMTIPYFSNRVYDIDQFCTMAPYITPILTVASMFIWSFIGVRIVLSS